MAISDYLAPALQIGSTILSAGSRLSKANAYEAIGARKKALSEFEAQQLDQQAEASQGIGMRNAATQALNLQVVNSLALARAAASGAGASDPTVVNMLAQTAGESSYRQALALYEGESQARLDMMQAAATRYSGATAQSDADIAANQARQSVLPTVLSGGARVMSMLSRGTGGQSLYQRYWAGGDNSSDQTDFGNI